MWLLTEARGPCSLQPPPQPGQKPTAGFHPGRLTQAKAAQGHPVPFPVQTPLQVPLRQSSRPSQLAEQLDRQGRLVGEGSPGQERGLGLRASALCLFWPPSFHLQPKPTLGKRDVITCAEEAENSWVMLGWNRRWWGLVLERMGTGGERAWGLGAG